MSSETKPERSYSPSKLGRGRFVVVVGPDGAGKTTVARALLAAYAGPTAYFHFRPPILARLDQAPSEAPPLLAKQGSHGSRVLGWLRLARSFLWFWAGYLSSVRPALRGGALVVGDRWAYGYLVQPRALRFYGPRWLADAAVRAMPRPDLVVNLAAPPEVIGRRKQELTAGQVREELREWAELPALRLRTLSSLEAPEQLASAILAELDR